MYRALLPEEITLMQNQGCTADDWDKIRVANGFDPRFLKQVTFGGFIHLGRTGKPVGTAGKVMRPSGIYSAALYDCTMGDDVLICNVGRYIANYDIGDRCRIENVGEIYCEGPTAFGVGTEVCAINEGGGREVPIYNGLTSQIAYLMAMYRHRDRMVKKLQAAVREKVEKETASRGEIGANTSIVNTPSIVNVKIGAYAEINGVLELCNGTVCSTKNSPSYVGSGVAARDFILSCSSRVDTGSMLRRCFVGEGVLIENGFSAENSLFFANCHCTHGEACAVFAGPYTVSHHRSSLLIAGYFSFFNAGSGANQSNHMYKSGPVHQSVHLRGCKFGSDAYVLLPACTGVFTLVTGRHYSHHDTDHMPFSYLIEEGKESYLIPGVNLKSFGTMRDVTKWPKRDRRVGVSSDLIHYELMNPYTGGKILKAIEACEHLLARYLTQEEVTWNRVKIKTTALRKGVTLYRQGIAGYLGELFATSGEVILSKSTRTKLASHGDGIADWIDLSGMLVPRYRLDRLLREIENDTVADLETLAKNLRKLFRSYEKDRMVWAWHALSVYLNKPVAAILPEDIAGIIAEGEKGRENLAAAVERDAGRDQAPLMSVGYGIDSGLDDDKKADFKAVHGN